MKTVQVVFPLPIDREFTYRLPPDLSGSVSPGSGVLVPFRGRKRMGFVVGFTQPLSRGAGQESGVPLENGKGTRLEEVTSILDPHPLFNKTILRLTRWIADYYLCSWGEALKAALPPGMEQGEKMIVYSKVDGGKLEEFQNSKSKGPFSKIEFKILQEVSGAEKIPVSQLKRRVSEFRISISEFRSALNRLERRGILEIRGEVRGPRVRPIREERVRFVGSREEILQEIEGLQKRAPRQAQILRKLLETPSGFPRKGLSSTLKSLEKKGWVEFFWEEGFRDPLSQFEIPQSPFLPLTVDQEKAVKTVKGLLDRRAYGTVLLYGVTGSGKTEVYLQCVKEVLSQGRKAILLVPEISLTPQTVSRFLSRFGGPTGRGRVALLHSSLSDGERYDIWRKIRRGEVEIVIGARSAIFAPLDDVGIICVDEEHEPSYKQSEHQPRYHARDVAIMRASMENAVCILGSATPSFESYYKAQKGKYHFLSLPHRIGGRPLPPVEVVDMKEEIQNTQFKTKNKEPSFPILSRLLQEKIQDRLSKGEQIILFLNRRGYAPFLLCQECCYVPQCSRCSVTLTYHSDHSLLCHYCGLKKRVFQLCPGCKGTQLLTLGFGTERVEQELKERFHPIRVLRMDLDTTRRKGSHESIFKAFEAGEGDLLLGTQMVAKGFDLPRVTLVGVLSADTALHFPDLRSPERTFQLLSQVAGRTGRSSLGGEVVIQTYLPNHPAIQYAAHHEYARFYQKEIQERSQFGFPPFSRAVKLLINSPEEREAEAEARRVARIVKSELRKMNPKFNIEVLGPAPSLIPRIRGIYRWQILLQAPETKVIRTLLRRLQILNSRSQNAKKVRIQADVDPVEMV